MGSLEALSDPHVLAPYGEGEDPFARHTAFLNGTPGGNSLSTADAIPVVSESVPLVVVPDVSANAVAEVPFVLTVVSNTGVEPAATETDATGTVAEAAEQSDTTSSEQADAQSDPVGQAPGEHEPDRPDTAAYRRKGHGSERSRAGARNLSGEGRPRRGGENKRARQLRREQQRIIEQEREIQRRLRKRERLRERAAEAKDSAPAELKPRATMALDATDYLTSPIIDSPDTSATAYIDAAALAAAMTPVRRSAPVPRMNVSETSALDSDSPGPAPKPHREPAAEPMTSRAAEGARNAWYKAGAKVLTAITAEGPVELDASRQKRLSRVRKVLGAAVVAKFAWTAGSAWLGMSSGSSSNALTEHIIDQLPATEQGGVAAQPQTETLGSPMLETQSHETTTYALQEGETAWGVARQDLINHGDPTPDSTEIAARAHEIVDASGITWEQADKLPVGFELTLADAPEMSTGGQVHILADGENPWQVAEGYLAGQGNTQPTDDEIRAATQQILDASGTTWDQAPYLPAGYELTLPQAPEVLSTPVPEAAPMPPEEPAPTTEPAPTAEPPAEPTPTHAPEHDTADAGAQDGSQEAAGYHYDAETDMQWNAVTLVGAFAVGLVHHNIERTLQVLEDERQKEEAAKAKDKDKTGDAGGKKKNKVKK